MLVVITILSISREKGVRDTLWKKLICSLKGELVQLGFVVGAVGLYVQEEGEGENALEWY